MVRKSKEICRLLCHTIMDLAIAQQLCVPLVSYQCFSLSYLLCITPAKGSGHPD